LPKIGENIVLRLKFAINGTEISPEPKSVSSAVVNTQGYASVATDDVETLHLGKESDTGAPEIEMADIQLE
jgi:hypothetical protein